MIGTQATAAIRAELAHRTRGWRGMPVQRWRRLTQAGFFLLFVLAPVFDLFRLDLNLKHFFLLGMDWTLGLDDFVAGRIAATEAAINIVLRGGLPILGDRRHGALSSLEIRPPLLRLAVPAFLGGGNHQPAMRRAIGKQSLWDRQLLPEHNADGSVTQANPLYWLVVLPLVIAFAFLWAIALLTYLLPPAEIYGNLWTAR